MKKTVFFVVVFLVVILVSPANAEKSKRMKVSIKDGEFVVKIKDNVLTDLSLILVEKGEVTMYYWLGPEDTVVSIPCQYGAGKYTFRLFVNMKANGGGLEGELVQKVTKKVRKRDIEGSEVFLKPNMYVQFDNNSDWTKEAAIITADDCSNLSKIMSIESWIRKNFVYDYMHMNVKASAGYMPDLQGVMNTRMGTCLDLSSLSAAMLRSVGVPAKLVIGEFNGMSHAWVQISVDGKDVLFDPTVEIQTPGMQGNYIAKAYY